AGSLNLGLTQHLANDHLDVLVVDLHALQTVNVLDLANQVVRQRRHTLQSQNVMRVRLTVRNHLTALDGLTLEHVELAPLRNQLLVLLTIVTGDDQTPLALGLLTEAHRAGLLRENRGILRLTSLEQVSHARQTAGDVASLRRLLRDAGDNVTDRHPSTILQADQRAGRQRVDSRNLGVGEGHFLTLRVDEFHRRAYILTAALLRIEHHRARQARDLIDLRRDRHAVDEVLELQETRDLGDDRVGMGIPGRADLTRNHGIAFLHRNHRAVRNLVPLALATEVIHHADLTRARHRNQVSLLVLHRLDMVEPDHALVTHLDTARGSRSGSGTTDVEGTHRELCSRLTDRLRGDNTNSLTDTDRTTSRQIA